VPLHSWTGQGQTPAKGSSCSRPDTDWHRLEPLSLTLIGTGTQCRRERADAAARRGPGGRYQPRGLICQNLPKRKRRRRPSPNRLKVVSPGPQLSRVYPQHLPFQGHLGDEPTGTWGQGPDLGLVAGLEGRALNDGHHIWEAWTGIGDQYLDQRPSSLRVADSFPVLIALLIVPLAMPHWRAASPSVNCMVSNRPFCPGRKRCR
jgi:hypothetical protein